jgi:hypothetical protein
MGTRQKAATRFFKVNDHEKRKKFPDLGNKAGSITAYILLAE